MKKLWSKQYALAGLAVLAVAVIAAAPLAVNAESGSGRTGKTETEQESESTSGKDRTRTESEHVETESEHGTEVETESEHGVETESEHGTEVEVEHHRSSEARATTQEKKSEVRAAKLASDKLKVCQKREQKISALMSRLSDRGTKQLGVFTQIAERTEAFYAKSGKTLTNYDALVSEVAAKKAAAEATVAAVKSTDTSFKCDGTDPKGVAASFKEKMQTEITALNNYKTAIKNLITGVKSVQGTSTSSTEGVKQS